MKRLPVTILALALGCARREPVPPLQSGRRRGGNVLLVTIDTLRRDRLGAYGNGRGLTPNAQAWQGLGPAAVGRDVRTAIDAWQHAERLQPRDYDLLFNLGMVLADSDHPADARPYLTRFVREAPRARYARDIPRVEAAIAEARR